MGNKMCVLPAWPWPAEKKQKEPPIQICMMGLTGAGKSTVLHRMKLGHPSPTPFTIGLDFQNLTTTNGTTVVSWDSGGRGTTRAHMNRLYTRMDAFVFVVDSNDQQLYSQAKDELHRNLKEEQLMRKPVLLLCNKQDLPDSLRPDEVAEALEFDKLGGRRRLVLGVSATGEDDQSILDYGLDWLAGEAQGGATLGDVPSFVSEKDKELESLSDTTTLSDDTSPLSSVEARRLQGRSTKEGFINILGYDPTSGRGNLTLQRFDPIKHGTPCPFAKSSKLWGGMLVHGSSLEEQAKANVLPLTEFVRRINHVKGTKINDERLDGFCVELDDPTARDAGPEALGECVRRILMAMADEDPSGENLMCVDYVGRQGWRFRFAGEDFFLTTFAPCYPKTSSRFAFGTGRAFLFFQPEVSFLRHGLPADTAATNWDAPETARDKARVAFRDAGQKYHIPNTTRYPQAEHVVKPLNEGNLLNVVKWW